MGSNSNYNNNNNMKKSLLLHSEKFELLFEYSMWICKNGYMDTDWEDEKPYAIDEFLKEQRNG